MEFVRQDRVYYACIKVHLESDDGTPSEATSLQWVSCRAGHGPSSHFRASMVNRKVRAACSTDADLERRPGSSQTPLCSCEASNASHEKNRPIVTLDITPAEWAIQVEGDKICVGCAGVGSRWGSMLHIRLQYRVAKMVTHR
jgi:hypothetical protein